MRIGKSATCRTFVVEWDSDRPRIIVGLRGLDRPSIQWHLTLKWRRLRRRVEILLAAWEEAHRELAEERRVRRLLAEALGAIQWSGYAMIGAEPCSNCGSERDESHSDGCIVGVALAESGALDQETGGA